ncbi:MAG: histidinol-phosphate transaminase [Lachnospiraceae bacterium]|nr:histidinol-phosphate transaminase [Lachnospiraceae bacterium]MDY5741556.1 histidinol-phosphate transaminase [Lachnospiraceae bacterium]
MESKIRHGGDIYNNRVELDLSVNCNPLGLPEAVRLAAVQAVADCGHYPDSACGELRQALAASEGLDPRWYIFGNGAASILYQSLQSLRPKTVLLPAPGFVEYERAAAAVGAKCRYYRSMEKDLDGVEIDRPWEVFPSIEEALQPDIDLLILCRPNNPSGDIIGRDRLQKIVKRANDSDTTVLVDECFMDLTDVSISAQESLPPVLRQGGLREANLILLKAFTKTYAMPGLRLGYAIVQKEELRERILTTQPSWEVSIPAQAAGVAALQETDYLTEGRWLIKTQRKVLTEGMKGLGMAVYPSQANYLLFYDRRIGDLYRKLLRQGILIRDCSDYQGLGAGWYRICVAKEQENQSLLQALSRLMEEV